MKPKRASGSASRRIRRGFGVHIPCRKERVTKKGWGLHVSRMHKDEKGKRRQSRACESGFVPQPPVGRLGRGRERRCGQNLNSASRSSYSWPLKLLSSFSHVACAAICAKSACRRLPRCSQNGEDGLLFLVLDRSVQEAVDSSDLYTVGSRPRTFSLARRLVALTAKRIAVCVGEARHGEVSDCRWPQPEPPPSDPGSWCRPRSSRQGSLDRLLDDVGRCGEGRKLSINWALRIEEAAHVVLLPGASQDFHELVERNEFAIPPPQLCRTRRCAGHRRREAGH